MAIKRSMDEAQATRNFAIRNILTGHCGEQLTPDNVDRIVAEIENAMGHGSCAWAFLGGAGSPDA